MNQPIDYARRLPTQSDIVAFRRSKIIYVVGVALIWTAIIFIVPAGLHHGTDGQAENQIMIAARLKVIGGVSLAWLIMGLIRIVRSGLMRTSGVVWAAAAANLLVVLLVVATWLGY